MPAYAEMNPGLMDDFQTSYDWSLYKTTASLLSDSVSMYDDQDLFSQAELPYNLGFELPPKTIKTEHKPEILPSDMQHNDWQSKCIDHWLPQDCLFWLIHELHDLKVGRTLTEAKMERLALINGNALKNMSIDDFSHIFPEFGFELFNRLQRFKIPVNSFYSFDQWSSGPTHTDEPFSRYPSTPQECHTLTDLDNETHLPAFSSSEVPYCSQSEADNGGYKSDSSVETTTTEQPPPPEKRRPGRPRGTRKKKKPEKLGRLWEFIRDLLLNPMYNPSLICWENYEEGTFRFVHSDRVAKLWGSKKDNIDMNYEKLSRAMRYYYKSQVLLPVYGKRLVYKFGPTATGWRSERPIFRQG